MRGAFDFECYDWVNPLCCGLVWGVPDSNGNRRSHFLKDRTQRRPKDVAKAVLQFMWEQEEVTSWWAHNGGKYDTLFLVEACLSLGWELTGQVAAGRVIQLRIRPPKATRWIVLNDSYAVVPSSLRAASEDFELPSKKLFTVDDYSIDVRKWHPTKLKEGCLIDCVLVLELLDKVEHLINDWGGELKITFSASALSCVKSKLPEKIPSHKGIYEVQDIARKAYYGARVEVLHHSPNHLLQEYDVCSSYPWAMCNQMPWRFKAHGEGRHAYKLLRESNLEGLIYADVTVPEQALPPLPFRDEATKGIYFPFGTWRGWFQACELRYALSLPVGEAIHVEPISCIAYEARTPFNEFVNEVYKLKQTATGAVRTFAKLLLNGCYGKFGQAPERDELKVFANLDDADEFILRSIPGTVGQLSADRRVLTVSKFRWPAHTHYAIAGYVTAHARALLHKALILSVEPAYCDSDSVHCKSGEALARNGMLGNGLGQLKLELANYTGRFYAPKIYRLETVEGKVHLAAKGFPVEEEAFQQIIKGEFVEKERMRLIKTQLRKSVPVTRGTDIKRWAGRSSKRKPYSDGSTRAWHIQELGEREHLNALSPIGVHHAS